MEPGTRPSGSASASTAAGIKHVCKLRMLTMVKALYSYFDFCFSPMVSVCRDFTLSN
jgi:hypothetical protein